MSEGAERPGPAIFTPQYYRRMRELEASGWWNAGMRDVGARLLGLVDLPKVGTVLDVGCGSGQTMAWFRTLKPGWRTLGVDLAFDGLGAAAALGEKVLAASALGLPFRDGMVDLVMTLDVLQHLPLGGGDMRALGEMRRVLRSGGHMLVRTNSQAFPVTPDDPDYNFHRYEVRELRRKLESTGFTVVRLSRINALLGLAEIPRELSAARRVEGAYHGILARSPARRGISHRLKRRWLSLEGRAISRGIELPFGRTLIALCRS